MVGEECSMPWPTHQENGPDVGMDGAQIQDSLKECYEMLGGVSRSLMAKLCPPLGLDWGQVQKAMLAEGGEQGLHMEGGRGQYLTSVGADVWRIFQLFRPAGSRLPGKFRV